MSEFPPAQSSESGEVSKPPFQTEAVLRTVIPREQVLCFPTALLSCVGSFQDRGIWSGLHQDAEKAFRAIINSGELLFVDRPEAEASEEYVQLIPYCVILRGREMFRYRRRGSEGRLTGLYSVGVGGHINPADVRTVGALSSASSSGMSSGNSVVDEAVYYTALRRELLEEVGHDIGTERPVPLGIIYDPSNAVGRVHLGVVHVVNIRPGTHLQAVEPALAAGGFWPISELTFSLKGEAELYETWTQLVLNHIFS